MTEGEGVFERLGSRTLRDQIADQIRDAIAAGSVAQGERLVERKLATEFGASLSAVREALVELEAQGLVVRKRNSATHVVRLTSEAVEKLFKVRRALEGLVVEEAAAQATAEQREALGEMLEAMRADARRREADEFDDKLVRLHTLIWEAAGNEYLVQALQRTVLPYFEDSRLRRAASGASRVDHTDAYYARVLESHGAILDAIEAGDPDKAREAFEAAFQGWYVRALERSQALRNSEV